MSTSTKMRVFRVSLWTVLSIFVLGAGSYLIVIAFAPIPVTQAQLIPISPILSDAATIDFPAQGSGGTLIRDLPRSEFHYGSEEPQAIASITKLVTALVVLDKFPLALGESGPAITLSSADQRIYQRHVAQNGSVTRVVSGWKFSQREMLEIMLIPSSNNYADSLAIWAFGSEDAYVKAATLWLNEHGLVQTRVVDANGLDEANSSTTTDLLALGALALDNPVLAEIVNTEQLNNARLGPLSNSNILLRQYSDFSGLKTGTTSVSGACLLWSVDFEVQGQKHTMIGVSLGSKNQKILAPLVYQTYLSASDNFSKLLLIESGTPLAYFETAWGESVRVEAAETLNALVYGLAEFRATTLVPEQKTIEDGAVLGEIRFVFEGEEYRTELIANGSIEGPDFWWKLLNPGQLW
ncbi:MAG: hypothetical protein WBA28_02835 [Microbacteriaceae bacterium]